MLGRNQIRANGQKKAVNQRMNLGEYSSVGRALGWGPSARAPRAASLAAVANDDPLGMTGSKPKQDGAISEDAARRERPR
jgi:hypothetical protein